MPIISTLGVVKFPLFLGITIIKGVDHG